MAQVEPAGGATELDGIARLGEASVVSELDPYRDDRPSLLAENERLRKELARTRRGRAWPVVAALGGYLVLLTELREWLNGTDPVRYWFALGSLIAALGVSVVLAIRLVVAGRP